MLCGALSLSLRMSTVTEEEEEGDDFTLSADFALATMEEDDDDAGFSSGAAEVFASDDV